MSKVKIKIRKGDTVKVIAGNDKGKTGIVQEIITATNRVIVEGINVVTKHVKPSATNPNGGIEKVEAPINISNVAFVDPTSGEASRVGRKVVDGKIVRYAKKSGEEIK
ncbi:MULTISPECIES: 50S ribosomal protein L24 [Persicobacter]|uniref:Large ribosomal subunit protein uL24 n=1 Tax=Persicobacter diffluens TaxID=981 RepID=A0AAN4W073_9BACT|nr:50S ribosomal protein L24 [Persicobacter sp. CCB-QB2]GJM62055.1 50S ribosomal protein L24 [Persicobacter diffluens]